MVCYTKTRTFLKFHNIWIIRSKIISQNMIVRHLQMSKNRTTSKNVSSCSMQNYKHFNFRRSRKHRTHPIQVIYGYLAYLFPRWDSRHRSSRRVMSFFQFFCRHAYNFAFVLYCLLLWDFEFERRRSKYEQMEYFNGTSPFTQREITKYHETQKMMEVR